MLKRLLSPRQPRPAPAIPDDQRVYAIGDIHGRIDLLDELLAKIVADDDARDGRDTTLIFLGDLIDRGPDSAAVVERVRRLVAEGEGSVRALLGNHEEVMLAALDGKREAVRAFCRIGGRETILSYGLDEVAYASMDYPEVGDWIGRNVPAEHQAFLASLEDMVIVGDYLFVHAGIRPGTAIEEQRPADLRWIREPFLSHRGGFGMTVVHGHTIVEEVDRGIERIGIDTGGYATNCLTALGLEGQESWIIDTGR